MAGIDEYVELLLHNDDVGLSDSSSNSFTTNVMGTSARSSAQSKFGGYSAYFPGITNSYISVPDNAVFSLGTDKWTFDFWIRSDGSFGNNGIFGHSNGGGSQPKYGLYLDSISNGYLTIHKNGSGSFNVSFAWSPADNTWYHVAIVRDGSSWYCFIDGVQTGGTQTQAASFIEVTSDFRIGTDGEGWKSFKGWIDEFRFSKGVARWTSNFDKPTQAYGAEVNVSADPIVVTATQHGTFFANLQLSADPISIPITNLGDYVGGGLYAVSPIDINLAPIDPNIFLGEVFGGGEIGVDIAIFGNFLRQVFTDWIGKTKGLGPWNLTEQGDKFGYVNNPRWSSDKTAIDFCEDLGLELDGTGKHKQCGHWHKRPLVQYEIEENVYLSALVDLYEFDTIGGYTPHIAKTPYSNIVLVFYNGGINGRAMLKTIEIDVDGTILGTLDTLELSSGNLPIDADLRLLNVYGSVFVAFYVNSATAIVAETYEISSDGSISAMIDSEIFLATSGRHNNLCKMHDNLFVFACMNVTGYGVAYSFGVSDEGIITSAIDSLQFENNVNAMEQPFIVKYKDNIAAIIYLPGPTGQVHMVTISVGKGGSVTSSVLDSKVIDTGDQRCQTPMVISHTEGSLVAVAYHNLITGLGHIKTFAISDSGVITLTPLDSASYAKPHPYLEYAAETKDFIMTYNEGGTSTATASVIKINSSGIIEPIDSTVSIQDTGVSAVYPEGTPLLYDGLYGIVFAGQGYDGFIATISFEVLDVRIKSDSIVTPIDDEPMVWPMD